MKSNLISILIVATSIVANSSIAQDMPSDETTEVKTTRLLKAIDHFNGYFKEANANQLSQLLTEKYMHTNGSSVPYTKEVWLNYIRSRKIKLDTKVLIVTDYGMTDIQLTFYNDAALVNGVVFSSGEENGAPFDKKFRVTHLWVLENDQWKRAGFHDGVIP